jgi:hypothetical protein
MKTKTKTHTDRLWHELNRISAAAAIAETFTETLSNGTAKTKLTVLNNEIMNAVNEAMNCTTDIKEAVASI